ncbi:hypothetical protein AMATHDRAFT_62010 [Amanita thiersii Skay4041]|uniref:Major facilitator superfamily (MFS) profile domain-containing protein n=1 Tax=Amanita thiersii Skay4041 TaxID=703135 RepID=A0A2A9NQN2_9AGAR|nr:hypothetical protein AMATHDRAFT_62010 [Amanita thiersii Skay4041]
MRSQPGRLDASGETILGLPTEKYEPKKRSLGSTIAVIVSCTMALVINLFNTTSTSIALPTIGRDLNIVQAKLQWLVSAYSLSSGCLLVLLGRLADLYGRKWVFMLGSASLAAFTLGCGFAPNELALDVLRGFQGVGAAATIPASLGILAHTFPVGSGKVRSIAFATFAAGAPVGAFMGNCLGAVLDQLAKTSWRSNFFLSCGLTVFYMIIGWFSIDKDEPAPPGMDRRVDWIGGFLITAGLVLIIYVLSDGETAPDRWATSYIIACLVIGCLLVGLFLVWQWYLEKVQNTPNMPYSVWTPPPLMKLSLWSRGKGRFSVIMVIALLTWCTFLGWNFWATLYYQNYAKLTPISTMLRFIPMFVTGVICDIIIILTIHRVSVIWILGAGTLITGCAPIFFAVINPRSPYWAFGFPSAICSVFGADFVFAAGTLFVSKIVEDDEQSLSGALFQTMTQIGTAIGVIVTTIVFNRVIVQDSAKLGATVTPNTNFDEVPQRAQLYAYQAAQWAAFAFCMIATIFVIIWFRGVGIIGEKSKGEEKSVPEEKAKPLDVYQDSMPPSMPPTPTTAYMPDQNLESATEFSERQHSKSSGSLASLTAVLPWPRLSPTFHVDLEKAYTTPMSSASSVQLQSASPNHYD